VTIERDDPGGIRIEELRTLIACIVLGDGEFEALVEHGRPGWLRVKTPAVAEGMVVNVAGSEWTFLEGLLNLDERLRGETEVRDG